MACAEKKVISLKNVNDHSSAAISGNGEFSVIVGLNAEDRVCMIHTGSEDDSKICVPLFLVTVWPTSGMTITPTNKDLKCFLNNNIITSETNLLPGSTIEIGDKVMQFHDGPVPRVRRHLPPTPGIRVLPAAPPKPNRNTSTTAAGSEQPAKNVDDSSNAYKDWCVVHPPSLEEELVSQLNTPDEIANLAASFLNRQIHLHTDTCMTSSLMDQIFKVLQEVAYHRKDILVSFLKNVAREMQEVPEGDNQRPLHEAIISLLVELLKQFLDPVSQVILVLRLLRSLSHIQYNLATLVRCQATAAILGTLSAYLEEDDVQLNSLDILAKIATHTPPPQEKIALRETGVELVLRAMHHHSSQLLIVQAGCRTLSNLANTLYETANQIIDNGDLLNPDLGVSLDNLTFLLEYMFQNCVLVVQKAVRDFSNDLTIKTDGRKFLYIIAKLSQLQQKKTKWFEALQEAESSSPASDSYFSTEGILKKSRSFENLRQPERRVYFDDDRAPGVYDSDTVSPSDSEDNQLDTEFTEHLVNSDTEGNENKEFINSLPTMNNEELKYDDYAEPLVINNKENKNSSISVAPLAKKRNNVPVKLSVDMNEGNKNNIDSTKEQQLEVGFTEHLVNNSNVMKKSDSAKPEAVNEESKKNNETNKLSENLDEKNKNLDDSARPLVTLNEGTNIDDDSFNPSVAVSEHKVEDKPLVTSSSESKLDHRPDEPDKKAALPKTFAFDNPTYFELDFDMKQNHAIVSDKDYIIDDVSQHDENFDEITQTVKTNSNDACDDVDYSDEKLRLYDEIDIVHALVNSPQADSETTETNRRLPDTCACDTLDTGDPDCTPGTGREVNVVTAACSRSAVVETVGGQLVFVDSLDHVEDLSNCSSAEINFLTRLLKAQIVCRVCSLALRDEDSRAYRILDQPLQDLLQEEHLSSVLQQFVVKQYKPQLTLMDLDPGIAISLIDAVRYRSQVAPSVVQKTLIGVAKKLSDDLRPCCLRLTVAFFTHILDDVTLKSIVSDPNFCSECKRHLENVARNPVNRSDIDHVIGKLKSMIGFIS